jgi:predicted nucleotidyltransferase
MPTALELSRKGWKHYVEAASRRLEPVAVRPEVEETRKQLLTRVHKAAAALRSRFAVRRVVVFGSLAHAAWLIPDSDVDLAVEGLAPKDYWQAWRMVEEIIGDRPVDLVEIGSARESLRQAIERNGIDL